MYYMAGDADRQDDVSFNGKSMLALREACYVPGRRHRVTHVVVTC